jgi:hypothetical protein
VATRKRTKRAAKKSSRRSNSNIQSAQRASVERRLERNREQRETGKQPPKQDQGQQAKTVIDPRTGLPVKPPSGPARPGDPVGRGANLAAQGRSDGDPKKPLPTFKGASEAAQKIAGLGSGIMEKKAEERRKLADPALFGVSDKSIKNRLTAQQNAIIELRNKKVKAAGEAVFMGSTKHQVRRPSRGGEFEGGTNRVPATIDVDDVRTKDELMSWLADEANFNKIKAAAQKSGIDVQSYDDVAKVWKSVIDQAAATFSTTGKKVTPWALLQLRGKNMVNGKPASRTTTSTSIDEMDPAEAKAMVRNAAGQMLGRDPTKEEIEDFIAKAQTIARRNPNVTTTTTNYGFDGEPVSQSSISKGGGDAVTAQAQEAALEQLKQSEDYTSYQGAGVIFPWLTEALASPV